MYYLVSAFPFLLEKNIIGNPRQRGVAMVWRKQQLLRNVIRNFSTIKYWTGNGIVVRELRWVGHFVLPLAARRESQNQLSHFELEVILQSKFRGHLKLYSAFVVSLIIESDRQVLFNISGSLCSLAVICPHYAQSQGASFPKTVTAEGYLELSSTQFYVQVFFLPFFGTRILFVN